MSPVSELGGLLQNPTLHTQHDTLYSFSLVQGGMQVLSRTNPEHETRIGQLDQALSLLNSALEIFEKQQEEGGPQRSSQGSGGCGECEHIRDSNHAARRSVSTFP